MVTSILIAYAVVSTIKNLLQIRINNIQKKLNENNLILQGLLHDRVEILEKKMKKHLNGHPNFELHSSGKWIIKHPEGSPNDLIK